MSWHLGDDDLLEAVSRAFDHDLPAIPDQLRSAAADLSPVPIGDVPQLRAPNLRRIERHLAAAAADGRRRLQDQLTSIDSSVVTTVGENDEARLVLTIRTADSTLLYVSLAWTLVDPSGVALTRRLVTPLALDRHGASVHYDIGSVERAEAIDIEAAEPASIAEVDADSVSRAFALIQTGSSRRAWIRAESVHRMIGDPLADVIRDQLQT